jgi:hypothetical protein
MAGTIAGARLCLTHDEEGTAMTYTLRRTGDVAAAAPR